MIAWLDETCNNLKRQPCSCLRVHIPYTNPAMTVAGLIVLVAVRDQGAENSEGKLGFCEVATSGPGPDLQPTTWQGEASFSTFRAIAPWRQCAVRHRTGTFAPGGMLSIHILTDDTLFSLLQRPK